MRIGLIIMAAIGAILAALVALASYRYLVPGWPLAPPPIAANPLAMPLLPIHAVFGASALALGPVQFWSRVRSAKPRVHLGMGYAYVVCCLLAGVTGVVLAFGSTAGPMAAAGFVGLGVVWIAATAHGLSLAARKRPAAHREWMIRSYALTFSAVTLRLYLPLPLLFGLDFVEGYRAISFLCWVPNLLAAELYIRTASMRLKASEPMRTT